MERWTKTELVDLLNFSPETAEIAERLLACLPDDHEEYIQEHSDETIFLEELHGGVGIRLRLDGDHATSTFT